MEELVQHIQRARRRLVVQQFLGTLVWTWFAGLVLAGLAIAVEKAWPTTFAATQWVAACLAAGTAAGLLAAAAWTALRPRSRHEAACEIDRRFGLKERVSTAASLTAAELSTEAGQAVLHDALERVERVRVPDKFAIEPVRRAWLPLVPALLAVLAALFVPARVAPKVAAATGQAEIVQVKNATQALEKKLTEKREEAKAKGLKDSGEILKQVAEGMQKLEQAKADPKEAMVQLNDLAKDLQKRRDQLLADNKIQQHLRQLKDLAQGPADKFAQAMKGGDLRHAIQELEKLQQRIAGDNMNADERQKLAEQLQHMQENLEKTAAAQQQARQDLQQQIDQQRQAGNQQQAERLQQQLDQLQQQQRQEQKMADMARKMAEASNSMKQGNAKGANQALDEIRDGLKAAQQADEELAMLDEALDEIADSKASLQCKKCQGAGCEACQGHGQGEHGDDGQQQARRPGGGKPGKGHIANNNPQDPIKAKLYDSKVPQDVRRGAAVVAGEADGPNRKGTVQETIKAQFESARHEAADPLTSQRLPREYREQAKKYFESLRDGGP